MTTTELCEDYLDIATAATQLQTTPTAILMLLRQQKLRGRDRGEGWEIDPASVAALLNAVAGETPLVSCHSHCHQGGCRSCEQPLP